MDVARGGAVGAAAPPFNFSYIKMLLNCIVARVKKYRIISDIPTLMGYRESHCFSLFCLPFWKFRDGFRGADGFRSRLCNTWPT